MSKKYCIFLTALFCAFLFGFGIAFFALPDRTFSEQENRYLSKFQAPTAQTLRTGEFMEDFEDYVVDQFPLRDACIRLKARCEKLLGKQEDNEVYFGADGQTLFAFFTPASREELEKRVGYVNKLADAVDVPVYFSLIPDKSAVWADRLPANAPNVDDGSTLEQAEALCSGKVTWVDVGLSGDDAFYRTDHHWTTFGAGQGYTALAGAMTGSAALPDAGPVLRSDCFYGTTWSACGAGWVQPDSIYTLVPEGGVTGGVAVTRYPEGEPVPGSLYDLSKLEQKDKYAMFLGGNQPLCILTNPDAPNGTLLVVRDSYADALAPFLALSYREVHLLDLRYYKAPVGAYAAQNDVDQVLVLYSAANFSTDTNLVILGLG